LIVVGALTSPLWIPVGIGYGLSSVENMDVIN